MNYSCIFNSDHIEELSMINKHFENNLIDNIWTILIKNKDNQTINGFFFYILYLLFNLCYNLLKILKSLIVYNTAKNFMNLILLFTAIISIKQETESMFNSIKSINDMNEDELKEINIPSGIGGLIGYLLGLLYNGGKFVLHSWHDRKSL